MGCCGLIAYHLWISDSLCQRLRSTINDKTGCNWECLLLNVFHLCHLKILLLLSRLLGRGQSFLELNLLLLGRHRRCSQSLALAQGLSMAVMVRHFGVGPRFKLHLCVLILHDILHSVIWAGLYVVQERALQVRLVELRDRHVLVHLFKCCWVLQHLDVSLRVNRRFLSAVNLLNFICSVTSAATVLANLKVGSGLDKLAWVVLILTFLRRGSWVAIETIVSNFHCLEHMVVLLESYALLVSTFDSREELTRYVVCLANILLVCSHNIGLLLHHEHLVRNVVELASPHCLRAKRFENISLTLRVSVWLFAHSNIVVLRHLGIIVCILLELFEWFCLLQLLDKLHVVLESVHFSSVRSLLDAWLMDGDVLIAVCGQLVALQYTFCFRLGTCSLLINTVAVNKLQIRVTQVLRAFYFHSLLEVGGFLSSCCAMFCLQRLEDLLLGLAICLGAELILALLLEAHLWGLVNWGARAKLSLAHHVLLLLVKHWLCPIRRYSLVSWKYGMLVALRLLHARLRRCDELSVRYTWRLLRQGVLLVLLAAKELTLRVTSFCRVKQRWLTFNLWRINHRTEMGIAAQRLHQGRLLDLFRWRQQFFQCSALHWVLSHLWVLYAIFIAGLFLLCDPEDICYIFGSKLIETFLAILSIFLLLYLLIKTSHLCIATSL